MPSFEANCATCSVPCQPTPRRSPRARRVVRGLAEPHPIRPATRRMPASTPLSDLVRGFSNWAMAHRMLI
jgi:hypothetical protein